jgi:hypothetical protein
MSQRLVIEITDEKEASSDRSAKLASFFERWSGYTDSALIDVSEILIGIRIAQDEGASDPLELAVKAIQSIGAGMTDEEYQAFYHRPMPEPDATATKFMRRAGMCNGYVFVSSEGIKDCADDANAIARIDISDPSKPRIDFEVWVEASQIDDSFADVTPDSANVVTVKGIDPSDMSASEFRIVSDAFDRRSEIEEKANTSNGYDNHAFVYFDKIGKMALPIE